jgi:hypothetical protein
MNDKKLEQLKNRVSKVSQAQGKKEYLSFLDKKKLTLKQAVLASCFMCEGYYADGKEDCGIADCPLYQWMPYRKGKK